jgi:error-prone DNA polymerase
LASAPSDVACDRRPAAARGGSCRRERRKKISYVELQVTSNYTFLEGGSHPDELVLAAAALGLEAIAITDRNSLAGVVQAHRAAKTVGIRLVVGARLDLADGASLLCLPTDRDAYGRLCQLLTLGRRRAEKGECHLTRADAWEAGEGQMLILLPPERPGRRFAAELAEWRRLHSGRVFLAAHYRFAHDDARRLALFAGIAEAAGVPLVATNDVLYHAALRRPLQDVLSAIRLGCTVAEAGRKLAAHAERHLKPAAEMQRLFKSYPDAVRQSLAIAERCAFSLDELRYEYPIESADPQADLVRLTWEGASRRYPDGVPDKIRQVIGHELDLIGRLGYAPYFLTVHDIVAFAQSRSILCQGRGSAANSAVCYCLGITAVDPHQFDLLFERFISAARGEPPDIDVDFEHERREEVIQYIYGKYGRERAGLAATVIHYRSRSALREVGRAMGLSEDAVAALAKSRWGRRHEDLHSANVAEIGFDASDPTLALTLDLARQLTGFPRHLSQHVGGFVMTQGRLDRLVPVENARMEDRTIIQWDKDDLDTIGLLKVDVLALGMLTCIRKSFDLLRTHSGLDLDLARVPREDPAVYDMLCRADSVGVFQIESRAQMSMLPRLKPRCFYDLVIEVAIVRPGPIQGDMVHPYLRRRQGKEAVEYPSPELEAVLKKTLGVPLFQEQAMKIAIVAAGFTPDEADQLRRAMASFRHFGTVSRFQDKLTSGMVAKGYQRDFAERVFRQIEGFGDYGFPESHAASFAHLVYVSSWLKCHHPAVFACALLNSQPMGFYAPAQIVGDARAHGVEVRPVDINHSDWDCTIERGALRLGFRQIAGFAQADAERLMAARGSGYSSPAALWRRASLSAAALTRLADADAFTSLDLTRRQALWAVRALTAPPPPLFAALDAKEPEVTLPRMGLGEEVAEDYSFLRLSLKAHPLALLRERLAREGVMPAARLGTKRGRVAVAGLVLVRQRPGTASGVVFMTLEDESGVANIVVWPTLFEKARLALMCGRLLKIEGRLQNEDGVIHVIAEKAQDYSSWLDELAGATLRMASRDFH